MEGGGAGGITIGARKVDGHGEIDLTASHDVVQERVQPDYLGKARQNLINAGIIKQKKATRNKSVCACVYTVLVIEAVTTICFSTYCITLLFNAKMERVGKNKRWSS